MLTTHLVYPTHSIHISLSDQDNVVCFKYNGQQCDFAVFQHEEAELNELSQYMLEPLPNQRWGFKPDNDG
jgi:hypothetical protein